MATRPIGYWVKELDRLLEEAFTRALASDHCNRRHWQLLNVLEGGPATEAGLRSAVAPFAATDAEGVQAGARGSGPARLGGVAPRGERAAHLDRAQAHRRLQATVAEQRRRIARG
jgi:hypothetical protein